MAKRFEDVLKQLGRDAEPTADRAVGMMADELLRLSGKEVPLDEGTLQNSGVVRRTGDMEREVGYHTPYAARLHEHPEYNFQHGRKGKYLEQPLKRNLSNFQDIYADELKKGLS